MAACLALALRILVPTQATLANQAEYPGPSVEHVVDDCQSAAKDVDYDDQLKVVRHDPKSDCGTVVEYTLRGCGLQKCYGRLDQMILHVRPGRGLDQELIGLFGDEQARSVSPSRLPLRNTYLIKLPDELSSEPEKLLQRLKEFNQRNDEDGSRGSWAELDYLFQATASSHTTPSGSTGACISNEPAMKRIAANQAHSRFTGSPDVTVAVIDSGIDLFHPALAGNLWINWHEWYGGAGDDDGNGFVDDYHGWDFTGDKPSVDCQVDGQNLYDCSTHGSHCAGIIGAHPPDFDHAWTTGVSPRVSLMPLKVYSGDSSCITTSTLVEAIAYAGLNGVDVVSASWGGICPSKALREAIRCLDCRGAETLFVTSTGKEVLDIDLCPYFPASYPLPNLIAVGASSSNDDEYFEGRYGCGVHLSAPGVNICSTIPLASYGQKSGTSMSTAFVAGAAALVKGYEPSLDHHQLRDRLLGSVDVVSSLKGRSCTGGRLNVDRALRNKVQKIPKSCNRWSEKDLCTEETARACFQRVVPPGDE